MAEQLVQPRAPAGQQAPQAPGGFKLSGTQQILIGAALWIGGNFVVNNFFKAPVGGAIEVTDPNGKAYTVPGNIDDIPPYILRPRTLDEGASYAATPQKLAPMWPTDAHVDITITLSDSHNPSPIESLPSDRVVFREERFHMGNYSDKRSIDTIFKVPAAVQNNGTLWGHFYLGLPGANLDPLASGFDVANAYHFAYPLTHYLPKKKEVKTRSLLDGTVVEEEPEVVDKSGPIIASYYHPNVTLSIIPDTGVLSYPNLHPAQRHFLQLERTGARDGSGKNSWYYPILFVNSFWQLRAHMTLLNDTVTELPLHIDLNNLRNIQFGLMASIELNSKETARQAAFGNTAPGGGDGSEIEMVKQIFLDSNPYLLAITAIVTVAHVILEMLAFGSDIAHYRKKKDNVGISVRSILANAFMQAVILLYLIDNSENTSYIILGSQGMGILIEIWKITTIVDVKVEAARPGSWLPFSIGVYDKHQLSETEAKTKEYDEIAFKYMYIAGVPLLLAYAVYSLVYDAHKSWYSYIITTLVGSVYAYGFLMMVPSLYINYRLKSVAHMPAKAMMYKFLNTFIDDLFAFTIKMPILHRLATFRDDIIFFIYIYQRWAYRIDYTRVNEFGQGGDDDEVVEADKAQAKELLDEDPQAQKIEAVVNKATGADKGKAAKKRK
ncbi:cleft lip and palate transmembrane protein 1 [Plectosphaerella cucumerina]|uniref:Cleft lip and palate transmembrane protein 1 n=1 Tax=Plectosphaerella cucumerina TaxID=40658 RepID=A0A8K0X513_9PEZI|nr:cleft lip and palate transmembrane protein 1 [Plectosphaerella cucumerina]